MNSKSGQEERVNRGTINKVLSKSSTVIMTGFYNI